MTTTYLINLSLFWLVAWAGYYLLLRSETCFRWNRFYLLVTFVLGLSWPWWQSWLPTTPIQPLITLPVPEPVVAVQGVPSAPTSTGWSTETLVYALWLTGSVVVALRFLWQVLALIRLIGRSSSQWQNGVCYLTGPDITEAGSWFCFLFLPSREAGNTAPEIITHELAHIRQRHSYDVLLLELVSILFWWHPLWHIYNRSLRQTHEYLADAAVLHQSSIRHYAHLLAKQASLRSHKSLVSTFYTSPLKQRIIMMTKKSPRLRVTLKYALLLPLLALLVIACAEGIEEPVNASATEAALEQEVEDETIYKVVDVMPVFGDCAGLEGEELASCSQQNLLQYIYTHVKYPQEAMQQGLEGTTVTELVVTETGKVVDVKTLERAEGPDPLLNAEALRVLQDLPDFQAGIKDGKAVKVRLVLPVAFRLE